MTTLEDLRDSINSFVGFKDFSVKEINEGDYYSLCILDSNKKEVTRTKVRTSPDNSHIKQAVKYMVLGLVIDGIESILEKYPK